MPMRMAVGWDHAGLQLGQQLATYLKDRGYAVQTFGAESRASADYPDFAAPLSRAIQQGQADLGILVCGTGVGMSLVANRFAGVRAALCSEPVSARLSRAHNDANVLCMGERIVGAEVATGLVDAFVNTAYEGGRHQRRLDKLAALQEPSCS